MQRYLLLLSMSYLCHPSFGKMIKNLEDNYTTFNKMEKIAKERGRSWITEGVWRGRCQENNIFIFSGIALFCYDKMEIPITNMR